MQEKETAEEEKGKWRRIRMRRRRGMTIKMRKEGRGQKVREKYNEIDTYVTKNSVLKTGNKKKECNCLSFTHTTAYGQ